MKEVLENILAVAVLFLVYNVGYAFFGIIHRICKGLAKYLGIEKRA